ncbi:MAG: hypothetical protein GXP63_06695, partial [DPANN group archaeon]|nr:hypothetical protein [DPANN group archaeon]
MRPILLLFFLTLLAISILLMGCGSPEQQQQTTPGSQPAATGTPPAQGTGQEQKAPDKQTVEQAKEASLINIQIMNNALRQADPDLCKQIDDENIRNGCLNRVIKVKALSSRDMVMCDQITDQDLQLSCRNEVNQILISLNNRDAPRVNTQEPTADCDSFTEPAERQNCLDLSTKTKALDQGDALLCDQIRDEAMKTSCKD